MVSLKSSIKKVFPKSLTQFFVELRQIMTGTIKQFQYTTKGVKSLTGYSMGTSLLVYRINNTWNHRISTNPSRLTLFDGRRVRKGRVIG